MDNKVLVVAYDFPPRWGGVATYGLELASGLKKKGCDVTVLTGASSSETIEDLKVKRVKLASSGITSIPLMVLHLLSLLRKEKFDAIYCCLWLPDAAAVYLSLKILKKAVPYFISVHAMEVMESSETLKKRFRQKLKPLKQATFLHAKKIFCVSSYTKKLLHSLVPLPNEQVVVVNNGANPEKFFPTEKKISHLRLLTACRLVPNKGVDQVIKVLPDLVKNFPDLQYRIVGEGPDKTRLIKLTEMMQMQDHVHFLGKLDNSQLLDEYQQADLFVMLSRKEKNHLEGFGLVFLEAALCETPSLGGNSGGIPDAIEDGVTGWLVDPYSENAISEKLHSLLKNRDQLIDVGRKARQKTLESKTWDHRIQQILKESQGC